jgi:hypothetical protein
MLSNKFIRLLESMCGAANTVVRVAANYCDQALLANDGIADCQDPVWFFARVNWCAFFQRFASLTNRLGPLQSFNFVLYGNTFTPLGEFKEP